MAENKLSDNPVYQQIKQANKEFERLMQGLGGGLTNADRERAFEIVNETSGHQTKMLNTATDSLPIILFANFVLAHANLQTLILMLENRSGEIKL